MIKIIIIGKRGFLGNHLSNYLKKFYIVSHKSYKEIIKSKKKLNKFNYVINTSIDKKYIENRYNSKYDNDLNISSLIDNKKTIFIFLSSRKVYKSKSNIKENSKLLPKSNYAKNKLKTENELKKRFNNNLVILRISNVIGNKNKVKKIHNTFVDIFFRKANKGLIYDNGEDFKDFISINKFCEIVRHIIIKNLRGIFNVSIGKKIMLNKIIKWLNRFNRKKILIKKLNRQNDCFYLNNNKLMSKIKITNTEIELKNYCHKISKEIFS
tara:strand:+ start:564 stop:1364 length:801 start_codon:yes stop_codon:yes gene_type:complete